MWLTGGQEEADATCAITSAIGGVGVGYTTDTHIIYSLAGITLNGSLVSDFSEVGIQWGQNSGALENTSTADSNTSNSFTVMASLSPIPVFNAGWYARAYGIYNGTTYYSAEQLLTI
jgi:hypothetical protein